MRRECVRWSIGFLAVAILFYALSCFQPRPCFADGLADEAELHFRLGADAYTKGDYNSALEHFLASNRLVPNRNVVYNVARTFERLSRFADAHRYYIDALAGETNQQIIQEINAALTRIAPSVAVLGIVTNPPGATIYLDRKDLGSRGRSPRPLAVAAGKYKVILEIEGYEPAEVRDVEAKVGSETKVEATLKRILGTVSIEISGAPNAAVSIDDERAPPQCSAPCTANIPPGRHILYFAREGYQSQPVEVTVVANQVVHARSVLTPLTGSVIVSADERDAVVEIDGKSVGFTPAVVQGVAVGKRRLRISLRGYAPVERDIDVVANQQTQVLDVRLTPLREVTAVSRFAESIEDAPSSVSIIDGQELRAFGYPHIAEALRGTRGVYLNNDHSYYSAGIRGLGEPNDYGNRVLILSDGQTLNDNLLSSSYIGSDGRVDLEDVDRIEVVRGPGSLLYGTGAFSGVVNLVTRPRDEPTSVHGGIGTYDNSVVHGRVGFHYNLSEKTGIWASVSGSRAQGVDIPITLISPPDGQPADQIVHHVDQHIASGTAGRLWHGPFTVQWFMNQREQHIPTGAYATNINDDRTLFTDTRYMVEARFEPKVNDEVQIFTRAHANRYTFHGVYSYAPVGNVEDYYGSWFGFEGRVAYTPSQSLRLMLGGEAQFDPQVEMRGCCLAADDGSATNNLYMDAKAPYNFGAVYALADASPAKWVKLSGGVRLDVYSTFGAIFVPRVGIILKPRAGSVIKLLGGRAFRAPSFYERAYTDGGVTEVPGDDPARGLTMQPESIWSGEIEYSQRFLEDWVALAAAHVGHVTGIINTIPDTPGSDLIRYANNPPAILFGGDFEIRKEWRQGWMLAGNYTIDQARYLKTPATLDGEQNPNLRLINAPDHLASFRFVVPLVTDVLSLATRASLESSRRIDIASDETTGTVFIGDVALSGNVRRFGLRWVLGIYNLGDYRWQLPVTLSYASRTMAQNGRTFLANMTFTYPP